jgi:branched-chain amino acid transport system permease protein
MGVVMDLSDRVVVLDYGRKIGDGTPDEVRATTRTSSTPIWECRTACRSSGKVSISGMMYSLIALGFVLIFKASGIFNFAQGVMAWCSPHLTLVGLHELGVPAWLGVVLAIGMMFLLALTVERVVLRPLVNQPDIILFMATIGLNSFLIGFGETIFGGEPKTMITEELGLPTGSTAVEIFGGLVIFQHLDIAAAVIAALMVAALAIFFNKSKIGRALRAVADDHQAAMSVGITLQQIWVIVWFAAGIVALSTGIMWGARSDVPSRSTSSR